MRRLWAAVKPVFVRIGDIQARVILVLLYVVFAPLGLVLRLVGDPLRRRPPSGPVWSPRPDRPATLEEAERQY